MSCKKRALLICGAAFLPALVSFTSCKGRTMENMEPTGDTVEVVIEQSVADTAPAPADTIQ